MTCIKALVVLDEALPDEKIVRDILSMLREYTREGGVEIELDEGEGKTVFIPENPRVEIVTKVLLKEYYDVNFRSGYRVQIALGGIKENKYGILSARYCFATLYYNLEKKFLSLDFHYSMK